MSLPDAPADTTARLIALATSLVGSAQEVMAAMQASEKAFLKYCAGEREPPWPEFDRLIALIVREQGKLIAKNRELLAAQRATK